MNEGQYKRIADEYIREYGAQLRRELEDVGQRPIMPGAPSPDRFARRGAAAPKRARYARYAGLIAACLAIALLTPLALRFFPAWRGEPGPGSYAPAPASPPAGKHDAPPNEAEQSGAQPNEPQPSGAQPSGAPHYEVLPLSFDIPGRFDMASVEQDAEKTIYHLSDSKLDNVIITLERSGDMTRYDTLTELPIGGHRAFGSSGNGYSLLAFMDEDSDILYVLTCRHDINTLVFLGSSIITAL